MKDRITWMLLGAALFGAGVFIGQQGANEAEAVGIGHGMATGQGNPLLFTQSPDGGTIYVWTTRRGEQLPNDFQLTAVTAANVPR